jgi:hypothetical protein
MIFIRALIFSLSAFFLIAGLTTMMSPDVNTIFLPISADTVQEAHFCRTYAGLVAAVGYLAMRFLYSSSKVQIGTVVLYITVVMVISKIFSFIYDGFTTYSVIVFFLVVFYGICLYYLQKKRKNQIDYNL